MKLGIHAGPRDLSIEELKRLWSIGNSKGFYSVSVWEHFGAKVGSEGK